MKNSITLKISPQQSLNVKYFSFSFFFLNIKIKYNYTREIKRVYRINKININILKLNARINKINILYLKYAHYFSFFFLNIKIKYNYTREIKRVYRINKININILKLNARINKINILYLKYAHYFLFCK